MDERTLTDKDAFVALKEEDAETRYRYENLRHRQKNGYSPTKDEKAFMKSMRVKGRILWNQRAQAGIDRLFE